MSRKSDIFLQCSRVAGTVLRNCNEPSLHFEICSGGISNGSSQNEGQNFLISFAKLHFSNNILIDRLDSRPHFAGSMSLQGQVANSFQNLASLPNNAKVFMTSEKF